MRSLLTGLLALPLFGQPEWLLPPPPDAAVAATIRNGRIFRTPLAVAPARPVTLERFGGKLWIAAPEQPCSVPLRNVLRFQPQDPPIRRFQPPPGRFKMRDVQVPAPSCEDKKSK